MSDWNLWHGCTKVSPGCLNCYVYRTDAKYGKDSSLVTKTSNFDLPLRKKRDGSYKITPSDGIVYTCFTSDFFHPDADEWRKDAWKIIKTRSDLDFFFITKRPERFFKSLPDDWGDGYKNVRIACTCENQQMADTRLPIFLNLPIKHKEIIHEPMLSYISLEKHLENYADKIECITCGGESGYSARICKYDWILDTRRQCIEYNIPFCFRQTGTHFVKDSKLYTVEKRFQHSQARKARIDFGTVNRLRQPDFSQKSFFSNV